MSKIRMLADFIPRPPDGSLCKSFGHSLELARKFVESGGVLVYIEMEGSYRDAVCDRLVPDEFKTKR